MNNKDIGLLLLRLGFAGQMAALHGWGKVSHFAQYSAAFPDPIGVGSVASLGLTIFAEFVCALLITLGIGTRLATVPLVITMAVAVFKIHGADPWEKKELAFLYGVVFLALFFTGAGSYSLGRKIKIPFLERFN